MRQWCAGILIKEIHSHIADLDIPQQRLRNQHLTGEPFAQPREVVHWLMAVQAQDYAGAKWAIAQRMSDVTDAALDQAFADGDLLRTHVLRPTWHVVAPEDIRWLLALTAPQVHAANAYYYRKYELDAATLAQSDALLTDALEGGQQHTRDELAAILDRAGIAPGDTVRLSLIIMHAELEGLICSGALRGKQHTYALLAERAPQARVLAHDEALAELARRYFTSHGPATLADFDWWAGLSVADAKRAVDAARAHFISETYNQQTYWFAPSSTSAEPTTSSLFLLPNYDEYLVAYEDRSAVLALLTENSVIPRDNAIFSHTVIADGQLVGTWKRTIQRKMIRLTLQPLVSSENIPGDALAGAAERYGQCLQLPIVME